jgi:hypothetical protein
MAGRSTSVALPTPATEGPSPHVPPRHARRSRRLLRGRRATRSPRVARATPRRRRRAPSTRRGRHLLLRGAALRRALGDADRRGGAPSARGDGPRASGYGALCRGVATDHAGARHPPVVEPVSIDEAYLDVSGLERLVGPPEVVARRTMAAIREAVGLTVSVGIGPNRLIAKLASDARKPDGLLVVRPNAGTTLLPAGTRASSGAAVRASVWLPRKRPVKYVMAPGPPCSSASAAGLRPPPGS